MSSLLAALAPHLLARVANRVGSDDKAAFRASCKGLRDAVFESTATLTWRRAAAGELYANALSEEAMALLAKCPHLRKLGISCMRVADLAPLAALTGLKDLDCPCCMGDLAPLAALTGLQSLCISFSRAADLGPLTTLTGLRSFDCSICINVRDLAPLAALKGLQSLNCSQSDRIMDLRPLEHLTGLQHFNCSECDKIADLGP